MPIIPVGPPEPRTRKTAQSDDPLILPFVIVHDQRERAAGWRFAGIHGDSADKYRPLIVPQREEYMVTADYTISGVPIFIERKSESDLIGSISGGAVNFRKEHERMQAIIAAGGHCCVIIESSLDRIVEELASGESRSSTNPAAVMGTVASYPQRFGVPWHFAGNRALAEELALRIFRKGYERLIEKLSAPAGQHC